LTVLSGLLEKGAAHLRTAGVEGARREARLLLAHALAVSQEELLVESAVPNVQGMMRYEALLSRRVAREPLAYILGFREFWSLPFVVGPGVLIPRPDTETLVDEALRIFPERDAPIDVLDLGTGSGCLLLSFLHERPQANGIGVDLSKTALSFAERNAYDLGLWQRIALVHGNWTDEVSDVFDVIFVNPPYVSLGEINSLDPEISYEPVAALAGGSDGFEAYRQLAPILGSRLKKDGRVFLEIGAGQLERIKDVFAASGLSTVRSIPDLAGIPRCLVLERSRH
jgi:release factor glutamine methyltransferase